MGHTISQNEGVCLDELRAPRSEPDYRIVMRKNRRDTWVFGYGSIIWRPDFEFEEAVGGILHGWKRRFWQGSPDHRGTTLLPGRVVTLLREEGALCSGRLFRLADSTKEQTLKTLDVREKGGYCRAQLTVSASDGSIRGTHR